MNITQWIPGASIVEMGMKLIDRLIPDPAAKAKAQLELMQAERSGELDDLKTRLSVIMAEAQSADPWTSRARPSFMYVVYIFMLSAIPMGLVYAVSPATASDISRGVNEWLNALPPSIIELFQWVMLGYIGGRSWEKVKGATK